MTDFEDRLTDALGAGAEDAPPAHGLAVAARRRARSRRRTTAGVVGVAAVLAVLVPVGVVSVVRSDGGVAPAVVDPVAVGEWQRIEGQGVTVEAPPGWVRLDTSGCDSSWQDRFGPPETDPCATPAPLAIFGGDVYDNLAGPGLDSGFVTVGDQIVSVSVDVPTVARRILASAGVAGEPVPDVAGAWRVETVGGFVVDVPADWPDDRSHRVEDRGCCARAPSAWAFAEKRGARWIASVVPDGSRVFRVTAPTEALALVVASSIRATSDRSGDEALRTVRWRDVAVNVPASWGTAEECDATIDDTVPVVVRYQAQFSSECPLPDGLGATFFSTALIEMSLAPGVLLRDGPGNWVGYATSYVGGSPGIYVRTTDRESGQAILDSFRRVPSG